MSELKKIDVVKIITLIRANYDGAYNLSDDEAALLNGVWYEQLKNYPKEIVIAATSNAIAHNAYAPRLAHIIDEINKLMSATEPTDEELWGQLTAVLGNVYDVSRYLSYPQHYKWANDKIKEIYDGLNENIKMFVVNPSTLVELAEMSPESLTFEKVRFFKRMPDLKRHAKDRAQATEFINQLTGHSTKLIDKK